MKDFKELESLIAAMENLSKRISVATSDVRDLRAKLAHEQQRTIERGREIALENAMLKSGEDDKQVLP